VERVIRETGKTLTRIIGDLDSSNWSNLRIQDEKLRGEITDIDTRYAQAVEDINTSNEALEADLRNILTGQVAKIFHPVRFSKAQVQEDFSKI